MTIVHYHYQSVLHAFFFFREEEKEDRGKVSCTFAKLYDIQSLLPRYYLEGYHKQVFNVVLKNDTVNG